MIQFVDKQFIMDMNEGSQGAVVIDADLQGAWEFNDQEQMKWAFPRAYDVYHKFCLEGLAKVGTSLVVEDCGYKIVILFTKKHRKDKVESIINNFNLAIDDMVRKIPSDTFIYSPVLGRVDHCFDEMLQKLYKVAGHLNREVGYNWFIYNKKGKI